MDISLVLRDIVDILPISPMPTLIMWLPWRLLVLVFTDSDQTFDTYCIKLRIYDQNWLVMVTSKYCWTILMMWTPVNWSNMLSLTVWKFTYDNVAKLKGPLIIYEGGGPGELPGEWTKITWPPCSHEAKSHNPPYLKYTKPYNPLQQRMYVWVNKQLKCEIQSYFTICIALTIIKLL